MSDLISVLLQYPILLVLLVLLFLVYCVFKLWLNYYKIKRMFDNDANVEERLKDGTIKKGYHRNIWDLGMFPGVTKLFFTSDWKIAVATFLLLFFVGLYLFTKEQWMAELIKVNFGLVIGALIGIKNNNQQQS